MWLKRGPDKLSTKIIQVDSLSNQPLSNQNLPEIKNPEIPKLRCVSYIFWSETLPVITFDVINLSK